MSQRPNLALRLRGKGVQDLVSQDNSKPTPHARTHAAGSGRSSSLSISASTAVEVYDPTTDQWSTRAPMSEARFSFGLGVINGILYAVGGPGLTTSEAYDPVTNQWSPIAPLPTAHQELGAAVVGHLLYATGGQPATSDNEVYQP
jgi:Kelch motif